MAVTAGLAIAGAAVAATSAIVGAVEAGEERDQAQSLRSQALQMFDNIRPTDYRDLERELGNLRQQNILTPEVEASIRGADVELRRAMNDPQVRNAQTAALGYAQDVLNSGGLTAQDRARVFELQSTVGQQMRGAREAALGEMSRRGMAGSGAELATRLAGQQEAGQRAAAWGVGIEGLAEQRRDRAAMAMGQLGTQIGQQRMAGATALGQLNMAQQQALMAARQRQQAMQANLLTQQAALRGQGFGEQMQVAGARAGQYGQGAAAHDQYAREDAARWGAMTQAGLGMMGAGVTYGLSQPPSGGSDSSTRQQGESYTDWLQRTGGQV
jgi:hypothetical protein